MSQPPRRTKDRISVLVVTAHNMTSESLKNAFARGPVFFKIETLTGSFSEDYRGAGGTQSGRRAHQRRAPGRPRSR
jgi:hypothetical protein